MQIIRNLMGWLSTVKLDLEYRRKPMKNKRDILIIVIVLTIVAILTSIMYVQTKLDEQRQVYEQRIEVLHREKDQLIADAYWNGLKKQIRFVHPIKSRWISSEMGYRKDPMGGVGDERLHKGIDIVDALGTPVVAVMDGVVMEHWLVPGVHGGQVYNGHDIFGGFIVIKHSDELYSLYGHLGKTEVHEGDYVEAGEKIGELGNTGLSTGPHLHFEIVVDPFIYLEGGM